ncbi:GGDEF domain-containing protein [Thalassotalea sp. 1_MG-2023]|uniref:EAL domain-containing protein n=1 Tax=Thalassotalea sp. 1_MG-2023 TaxID=3062680 RepID=UPI0026E2B60B|nr:GGDEF domain-containing protein [Thalassotalea sp. 1_MG-2023]MDO6426721.1 GGDEF domain-containing protein [Thalassotalea sp. 1_MG-2023]
MFTFSQIISRNIAYALLFNIIVLAVTFFIAKQQVAEKQHQHGITLSVLFKQSSETTFEQVAQSLLRNQQLSYLKITNNEGVIFQHSASLSWLDNLLASQHETIAVQSNQYRIEYAVNPQSETKVFFSFALILLISSFLLALIAAKLSIKRFGEIIQRINKQINQDLNHAIGNTEVQEQTIKFDLPELDAGIDEIKKQISTHMDDTKALESDAYIDRITQLENRNRFVQYFELEHQHIEFGVLTITRCSELQTINQIHGYHEGDNYIAKVADIIKNSLSSYKGAKIFRLNSSDFACVLPNTTMREAENFADNISSKFNDFQLSSDLDSVAYTGLVTFTQDNPLGELLALADTAISVAQTQQINAWYAQTDTDILNSDSASYGNQNWRQEIESVLENQRVTLLVQPIKPNTRTTKMYGEFLARFLNSSNEMLPTASFIAMAEKLDKIVEVDRMIIEQAITLIGQKNLVDQNFGINISPRSISDEHFLIWLERRLLRDPKISASLVFEISEFGLQQNIKTSKRFIDLLHRTGARVTVERFGVGLTSFKFFRDLKPDFIKMDSTYTRDIDEDKNNQYFLRLMIDLAHRLSITVLAESVESQEEKFTLEKLFIDGCQGYYIGKPEKI